ncbi:MAG: amidohydrolase family protein [Acidobacteria bacterium]|nr:amidohydrolase family protein [Acidobacteriota bacterium]
MHRPLLLRGARQLLTLRGSAGPRRGEACLDLGVINDGSVLIRDGRILNVGPSRRVDNLAEARNAVVHECGGTVVMPSFIDAQFAVPSNAAFVRRILDLAFFHGSGTIAAVAPYSPLRALSQGKSRPQLISTLELEKNFDEPQLLRAIRRDFAAFLRVDLHAHTRDVLRHLRRLGAALRIYTSVLPNPDWIGLALAYGAAVIEISRPADPAQIALLAEAAACAVVTPAAAAFVRALLDGGAAVALGSGFSTTGGGTCSMQTAAVLAARDGGLDIAEAITLSTLNAACALGVASRRGSLEAGKEADILALHLSDYRDLGDFTGVNVVSKCFRAGTLVS